MIRAVQRYKNSIFGLLVIGLIAMSMIPFGTNFMSDTATKGNYAIKVNQTEISFDKLYRERKDTEARYQQMLGKQYDQMKEMLNINQTVVDRLIAESLIDQLASNYGFVTSRDELKTTLQSTVFRGGFSQDAYNNFLSQMRMTAQEFEADLASDLKRQQFGELLSLASEPSKAEIKQSLRKDMLKYSIDYVVFNPKDLISTVPPRPETDLKDYYDNNSTEFELPAKVSYDYVVVNEANFPNAVQVTDDEIAIYYSDNENKFKTLEERKVSRAEISLPKDAKEEQKTSLRKKAEELVGKDSELKDIGFVQKGKMSPEFDEVVFSAKVGDPAKVIETAKGFEVVKVTEIKEPTLKPLDSVKNEILATLKKENAPSFLMAKADELFESWTKTDKNLADFLATQNAAAKSTNGLIDVTQDPEPTLRGLSREVYDAADQNQRLVELGSSLILISLKESKEPTIATFDAVKDKIVEKFKREDALRTAQKNAEDFLQKIQGKKLRDVAAEQKLAIKEVKNFSNFEPSKEINNQDLQDQIFAKNSVGELSTKPVAVNGEYYLFQVTELKPAADAEVDAKLAEYTNSNKQRDSNTLLASILSKLKASADKDINARALAG